MILWSIENYRPRGELNSKIPNDPTLGQLGVPPALLDPEAYRFSGTLNVSIQLVPSVTELNFP